MLKNLINKYYPKLDSLFREKDKSHIRRTKNIRLIPDFKNRRGGKLSYAEWAHVIGVFQTLIYQNNNKKTGNDILDIGCGTGLLGIASEPFTYDNGSYTGLDVMQYDINYCREHFKANNYNFIHFDIANASYAESQDKILKPWPIDNESKDLITALSVWTHLQENDAIYYFKEIERVLKIKGKAIITFFYLDELYHRTIKSRKNEVSKFHFTNQNKWIFDQNAYNSKDWLTPKWNKYPEDAIGITKDALAKLIKESGLKLIEYYPGNWKEEPGVYFQDILIFEK